MNIVDEHVLKDQRQFLLQWRIPSKNFLRDFLKKPNFALTLYR